VGLEWGPLSLVKTIEELFGRKSSGSGFEYREYGLGIRHANHVASINFVDKRRSLGIVRSRTQAMEFSFILKTR
jgi:hypothetical protein